MKVKFKTILASVMIAFVVISNIVTASVICEKSIELVNEDNTQKLSQAADVLKEYIDNIIYSISKANAHIGVYGTKHSNLNLEADDPIVQYNAINDFTGYCNNIYSTMLSELNTNYQFAFFMNEEIPASTRISPNKMQNSGEKFAGIFRMSEIEHTDWYQGVLRANGGVYSFVHENDNEYVYFADMICKNEYYAEPDIIGVSVIGINMSDLLVAQSLSSTSNLELQSFLCSNNQLIASNIAREYADITKMETPPCFDSFSGEVREFQVDADRHVFMKALTLLNGYELFVFVPYDGMNEEIIAIAKYVILALTEILLVFMLLSYLFSFVFTKPMKKLAVRMDSVKNRSDFDACEFCDYESNSVIFEVHGMQNSFNHMLHEIDQWKTRSEKMAVKEKISQIKLLQSQIKPHYLYNILDHVAWVAIMRDENEIADLITMLSENMVYMLGNVEETIALSRELDFIQNYVELDAIIADKEIDLITKLPDDSHTMTIPKFVLQPIVENSIRHGFAKNEKRLEIIISIERDDRELKMTVQDSGVGCAAEKINAFLDGEPVFAEERVGLRNVSQRLKLLYGSDYGLSYRNDIKGHLIAEITIPNSVSENLLLG